MRRQLKISMALSLLVAAGMTVPACLADSEASLQASSLSESNNNSEQARQSWSESRTMNESQSGRQNSSQSTIEAQGPYSTSVTNLHEPGSTYPLPNSSWGSLPSWGGANPLAGQKLATTKPESAAKPAKVTVPHMQVTTFHQNNAQLASRPLYSYTRHTVIRRGANANSRYTYMRRQIRRAEVTM